MTFEEKKSKKEKKEKKEKKDETVVGVNKEVAEETQHEELAQRNPNLLQDSDNEEEIDPEEFLSTRFKAKTDKADKDTSTSESAPGKQSNGRRYILFVGNLPYNYTPEDVHKLFDKIKLISVRMPRDKSTQLPKGFAFIEFDNHKDLHYALGYHKTLIEGRRINVELTVGGGGNSKARKSKIAARKQDLAMERYKKMQKARDKQKLDFESQDE